MTYIFGDLGRCWPIFRDLGSKGKIQLGSRGNYFQGSGEINALFSGIKGAQTPPGGASVTPVRLEPTVLLSRVKHSTTEPLCSL